MKTNPLFSLGLTALLAFPLGVEADVVVDVKADEVTIGNEYLSRTFKTSNHQLLPGSLTNKRTENAVQLTPGGKSEEFILKLLTAPSKAVGMDRKGWTATASSQEQASENGSVNNLLDGKLSTIWHTRYSPSYGEPPHWLQVDMKKDRTFRSFAWVQRQVGTNGYLERVRVYVSSSETELVDAKNLVYDGTLKASADPDWINLPENVTGRYIHIDVVSSSGGFASGAEFYVSDKVENQNEVKSSDLTLNEVRQEEIPGGKRVIFDMAPYLVGNVEWDVDMVVEMKDKDTYMKKYLTISVPEDQQADARIDFIDLENMNVVDVPAENRWTRSLTPTAVGGLNPYLVTLGQPIYLQGMYVGSEFPETENVIESDKAYVRYYSGKSFADFKAEGRLEGNAFSTWKNVVGATRSNVDMNVIRSDFFSYITSIAKPVKPRLQYNSWYDWMLWIDEEKINESFREIERGLTSNGLRPIDSYVVDDGWNAYGNEFGCDINDNTTGFWQFNTKFPTGLAGASNFAHKVGSQFGIWLGPRGGYNFSGSWGKFLEEHGTGTSNRNCASVVTGDKVYVENLEKFFLDCQNNYGVNYWKIDGFIDGIPQPSTNGRYITGGHKGMYYVTEHWERWMKLLDHLYENKKDLWINLTCYVNPSPWMLQYSNSIWLQNSADCANIVVDGRTRNLDQRLSYRDDRYYDFYNISEYQLPPANIFHHDPVYGRQSGNNAESMTDEEFRTYLYFMATRGAAFWEMLWSYELIDSGNKWMVNVEALKFLEENFDILRHSILFGGSPKDGEVYGYSCWNNEEGILSLRNPSNSTKTYTVSLNNTIGVYAGAKGLHRNLVMSYDGTMTNGTPLKYGDNGVTYSYGDEMKVTLEGGEVQIWKFTTKLDTKAPELLTVSCNEATDFNRIKIVMDEPLRLVPKETISVMKDGQRVTGAAYVRLMPDYRTLVVKTEKALELGEGYTVKLDGIADWQGNKVQTVSPVFYVNKAGLMVAANAKKDFVDGENMEEITRNDTVQYLMNQPYALNTKKAIIGKNDFNVSLYVQTTNKDVCLVQQQGAYRLELQNGVPVFSVGALSVMADKAVADGVEHFISVCRERNGMLKVYIDDVLCQSSYDQNIVNLPLAYGKTIVGDNGGDVYVREIKVHSKALNMKEVSAMHPKADPYETATRTKLGSVKDLKQKSSVGYGELQIDRTVDQQRMKIRKQKYDFGVGVHAPSVINIKVNGAKRFICDLGIDDEASSQENYGVVDYKIIRNNKDVVMKGTIKRTDAKPIAIDLNIEGWRTMTLKADAGSINWGDHVDYAGAYFEYEGEKPVALTNGECTQVGVQNVAAQQTWNIVKADTKQVVVRFPATKGMPKTLKLTDLQGRCLHAVTGDGETLRFNVNLVPSVYMLSGTCGEMQLSTKLCIE